MRNYLLVFVFIFNGDKSNDLTETHHEKLI